MDQDKRMKGIERARKLKVPERFKDYKVMLTDMPEDPLCDVIYDMPKRTIWINTAAEPGANITRIEPGKG